MEKLRFDLAVAVTALVLTSSTSRAAERTTLTVVLHLTDFAGVNTGDFGRARVETERIYREIDVRVLWVGIADGPKARACEGHNVFVSLLSPFLVNQVERQKKVGSGVLGGAFLSTENAFILTERVTALAARRGVDENVLLGRVIAHEVGHLLLSKNSHSGAGVMTEDVHTDRFGLTTFFLPEQRQAIRTRLEAEGQGESNDCAGRAAAREP